MRGPSMPRHPSTHSVPWGSRCSRPEASRGPARSFLRRGVEAQGEQGPDCYTAVMPRAAGASYPVLEKKCHCQALWEVPSVWWVPPFLLLTRLPTRVPGRLRCAGAFRGPPGMSGTSGPLAVEGRAQVPDGPHLGRPPGPVWRPEDSASVSSLTGGGRCPGVWGGLGLEACSGEGPGGPLAPQLPQARRGLGTATRGPPRLAEGSLGTWKVVAGCSQGQGSQVTVVVTRVEGRPWSCSAPERIKGEKASG